MLVCIIRYTLHTESLFEGPGCVENTVEDQRLGCVYVLKGVSVITWLTAHETEKLRSPRVTAERVEQHLYVYIIRVVKCHCVKYDVWGCFFSPSNHVDQMFL